MNEIVFLVDEDPEGGYTARAIGHPIFTEADRMEELKDVAQEAILAHFEDKIQQTYKIIFVG